jgi:hypothetical protein
MKNLTVLEIKNKIKLPASTAAIKKALFVLSIGYTGCRANKNGVYCFIYPANKTGEIKKYLIEKGYGNKRSAA